MPLGFGIGYGELFACLGAGAEEFGDIFLEGANGAGFGGAGVAAFGKGSNRRLELE